AREFTGQEVFRRAWKELGKVAQAFAVTRGDEGSVLYDGSDLHDVEPVRINAVDTNGAGDMFAGTFLYGITNEMTFKEAGNLASRTSAKVVSQYGPRLNKDEMRALIEANISND